MLATIIDNTSNSISLRQKKVLFLPCIMHSDRLSACLPKIIDHQTINHVVYVRLKVYNIINRDKPRLSLVLHILLKQHIYKILFVLDLCRKCLLFLHSLKHTRECINFMAYGKVIEGFMDIYVEGVSIQSSNHKVYDHRSNIYEVRYCFVDQKLFRV